MAPGTRPGVASRDLFADRNALSARPREVRRARGLDRMRYLRRMSLAQSALLYAGVGCTFATVGFVTDLVALPAYRPFAIVLATVAMCGLLSCGYLAAAIHGVRWIPLLFAAQIGLTVAIDRGLPRDGDSVPPPLALERVAARAALDGVGCLFLAAAGYGFFIGFIGRQGIRQVRLETEMSLARDIHADLVPAIERRIAGFEIVGRSLPSTEVGGDLLDVFEDRGALWAIVADVSGHGVPAGTLMAMMRSAIRVRVAAGCTLEELFENLDQLLLDLHRPDKFATIACLRFDPHGEGEGLLAGHLPVIVVRAGTGAIEHIENRRPPIGLPVATAPTRLRHGAGTCSLC